jgi:hypothetical protein
MEVSKWTVGTRNKIKLAFVFTGAILLLLFAKWVEQGEVEHMDKSFLSIYADRLVPATAIFDIRENMHRKQEAIENLLTTAAQPDGAPQRIAACNAAIGRLLTDYKKTYFLKKETDHLAAFEANLLAYNQREKLVLKHLKQGDTVAAGALYRQEALGYFTAATRSLSELNHIQSEIGKDILAGSQKSMASFLLLSKLELGLILLFSILAHILIYASRAVIQRKVETFHMN